MLAKIIKTGKVLEFKDYGPKVYPRYWADDQGYCPDELNPNIVPWNVIDEKCDIDKENYTCILGVLCNECTYNKE